MDKGYGRHAVVIGGGIAGLCAARALSGHFSQVTIIERDRLPTTAAHRPGAPQSHHVHALLLRGLMEMETLFPGLTAELLEHGAGRMDFGSELLHYSEWGWAPREHIGVSPITVSRLLLEFLLRHRVKTTLRNVRFLEETRVTALLGKPTERGVVVLGVSTDHPEKREVLADLVVDASGRNSKILEWLTTLGVSLPAQEVVDAFAGYASRFYELSADDTRNWRGMLIDAAPPDFRRWGLLMPIEHGRWVLTLAGINRDYPPTDEEGFHAYLNSLRSPLLAREIARAKPLSDIRGFRPLMNRARRFDRWDENVAGLIVTGDSAVAFNATHGQGMTMAAWSATTLSKTLDAVGTDDATLPRAFHKAQWKVLSRAWKIATTMDFQWPETSGQVPLSYRLLEGLTREASRAAVEDPKLKAACGPVFQLVEPPSRAMRPSVLLRVLYVTMRRRLGFPILSAHASPPPALPSDTGPHIALG